MITSLCFLNFYLSSGIWFFYNFRKLWEKKSGRGVLFCVRITILVLSVLLWLETTSVSTTSLKPKLTVELWAHGVTWTESTSDLINKNGNITKYKLKCLKRSKFNKILHLIKMVVRVLAEWVVLVLLLLFPRLPRLELLSCSMDHWGLKFESLSQIS